MIKLLKDNRVYLAIPFNEDGYEIIREDKSEDSNCGFIGIEGLDYQINQALWVKLRR